jgi:hypothetical protein
MKNVSMCAFVCIGILAAWQLVALSQSGPAPQIAFDIPKTDIDTLLKNAPPAVDQQLRVVDMGKYNLGVGVIHRERLAAQSGGPVSGPYHDSTAEVYIVLSGSGVLTTGGTITDKKPSANYNLLNGPGGNGVPGQGAYYVNPLLLKNQPAPVK